MENDTHDGWDERYAYSPITGNWYLVTEWDDLGNGKIKATEKERVAYESVPQEWIHGVIDRLLSEGDDHE